MNIDSTHKKNVFKETSTSSLQFFNDTQLFSMTDNNPLFEGQLILTIENVLGKKGTSYIYFRILLNQPPVANIIIEDIPNSTFEKKISVSASDPEEDEIIAYEYCIDGSVYSQYYGYEYQQYNEKCMSGQAAYNGTYITATSLYTINHAFQTLGTHTIYVRCQDKNGGWSKWVSKTILIK